MVGRSIGQSDRLQLRICWVWHLCCEGLPTGRIVHDLREGKLASVVSPMATSSERTSLTNHEVLHSKCHLGHHVTHTRNIIKSCVYLALSFTSLRAATALIQSRPAREHQLAQASGQMQAMFSECYSVDTAHVTQETIVQSDQITLDLNHIEFSLALFRESGVRGRNPCD